MTNVSPEPLTWGIKDRNEKRLNDGTFKFIMSSKSGISFELPLISKTDPLPGEIGYLAPGQSFKFKVLFSPGMMIIIIIIIMLILYICTMYM